MIYEIFFQKSFMILTYLYYKNLKYLKKKFTIL